MPLLRHLPMVLLVTALNGCATYGDWVGEMERQIVAHDLEGALHTLKQHAGQRDRDEVLYDLNRAMLLRMMGDYAGSNEAFEQAKVSIDRLEAVSITEQTGALAVNDMMRAYVASPFERVLLHVYAALNHLDMAQPGAARVEILQLDVLLGRQGPVHGEAFALYLSGMIFEALGQNDDAVIAYRKAYEAYRRYGSALTAGMPQSLGRDLVRTAAQVGGLEDEVRRYRLEFALPGDSSGPKDEEGEIIFLLHSGLAPIKRDVLTGATTHEGKLVTISMPYYERRAPRVAGARLDTGAAAATTELVEDLADVAVDDLEQQMPLILARAVARAALKHAASEEADKENEALGAMINIAGVVSERADTRSWSTLPNRIYLARLPLAAGRHAVRVELKDRLAGTVAAREYTVELSAGEKRFISLHWVTAGDLEPLIYPIERRRWQ